MCELVGFYLLSKLNIVLDRDSGGLYRNDGLAAISRRSGRRLDQLRKQSMQLFKSEGLAIAIEINLFSTDYLDVMFTLDTSMYSPY